MSIIRLPPFILLGTALSACALHPTVPEPLPTPAIPGVTLGDAAVPHSIDLSKPLDADALATIAVYTNPDLKALRARQGVADAQVFAAGLYPDPTFSAGFGQVLSGSGLVTALAASLGTDFLSIARRPSAVRQAFAHLEAVRYDIIWAEWLTGEQAQLLAAKISHLDKAKMLTTELRRLAEDALDRALRAASRGDIPASALEARRLAATDAADRDRSTESQLEAARLDLNRLLGLDPAERLRLAKPQPLTKTIPSSRFLFQQAVENRADLAGLRAAYTGSQAALSSARLGAYPLPALSLNIERDTGAVKSLGPSVAFSLPVWNRGRGNVALVRATRAQARAEYAARLEKTRSDIASARSALQIALNQYEDVARQIAPLRPQADAAEHAAQDGDISLAVAVSARLALLDKQIVERRLSQAVAELGIALEIAAGRPLEAKQ